MMKSNSIKLITLLVAAILVQSSLQQNSSRVYCDPLPVDTDPSELICTLEFNPVCGYSNDSSSNGTAAGNPCQACIKQGIDYYVLGACEGDDVEEDNDQGAAQINQCTKPDLSATDVVCTLQYEPVCAYYDNDTNMTNGTTVGNACGACLQQDYDYYINGTCPGDEIEEGLGNEEADFGIVYCEQPDLSATNIVCTEDYVPVCAYHFDWNTWGSGKTIGNACQACLQNGYDYYVPGACSDEEQSSGEENLATEEDNGEAQREPTQCPVLDLSATDVVCTLQYEPVCAFYTNDTDFTNGTTVGNACQACQQQGFDLYIQGACEDDNQNEEEIVLNTELYENNSIAVRCELPDLSATDVACVDIYEPVCGLYYNDTTETNGVTVSNACQACLIQRFDYYVQGECPSSGSEEESNEVVAVEESNIERETSNSNELKTTRCQNANQSAADVVCTLQYDPVCAYSDSDPNNGSTVGNACQACSRGGLDYYTKGACEQQS